MCMKKWRRVLWKQWKSFENLGQIFSSSYGNETSGFQEEQARLFRWQSPTAQQVKNPPANAGDAGDASSIPGSGRSPGEGNGNPLQYSCLGNPMDRGTLQSMGLQRAGHDLATEQEHWPLPTLTPSVHLCQMKFWSSLKYCFHQITQGTSASPCLWS